MNLRVFSMVVLTLTLIGCQTTGDTDVEGGMTRDLPAADITLRCGGSQGEAWQSIAAGSNGDVTVEYWSTGECRAYVNPAGGPTSGQDSDPSVAGGARKTMTFKNASSLKFGCRGTGDGDCSFRITKAVKAGQTAAVDTSTQRSMSRCGATGTIEVQSAASACDVLLKVKAPAGCVATVNEEGSSVRREVTGTAFVSFFGVRKVVGSCAGSGSSADCEFNATSFCEP